MSEAFPDLAPFLSALSRLDDGYVVGEYSGQRWGATVRRSDDMTRVWLFAEDLGGPDIVSFNLYFLAGGRPILKPCEMSSVKVIEFVRGFQASSRAAKATSSSKTMPVGS